MKHKNRGYKELLEKIPSLVQTEQVVISFNVPCIHRELLINNFLTYVKMYKQFTVKHRIFRKFDMKISVVDGFSYTRNKRLIIFVFVT